MTRDEPVTVRVKYTAGTYVTQTVRGKRASSTSAPRYAIQTLALKLFSGHGCAVRELPGEGLKVGESLWRIDPR